MIPHKIHLCWFGKGKYPELTQMCVNSWKQQLPEYEIVLWNEDTFPVDKYPYVKEAISTKQWAFASDYVRLIVLYQFGGVYLDTDVEVIKDFSRLLEGKRFVSSRIEGELITAGFIASEAEHPFIKAIIDYYDQHLINPDGTIAKIMNPLIFSKVAMEMMSFPITADMFQNDDITIFPLEYFMPFRKNMFQKRKFKSGNYVITTNTYTIHHDMGSWAKQSSVSRGIKGVIRLIVPQKIYRYIKKRRAEKLIRCM